MGCREGVTGRGWAGANAWRAELREAGGSGRWAELLGHVQLRGAQWGGVRVNRAAHPQGVRLAPGSTQI